MWWWQIPVNWSNRSVISSSLATLHDESWFSSSFSHVILACITSFTDSSDEGALPCWFSNFFWRPYFSYFAQKAPHGIYSFWHILTWYCWLWCLKQQCSCWKHMVACFVMEMICVAMFLCLLCFWLNMKFVDTITLTFTLQVGSSALVVWAYLLYCSDFIDTGCIWHDKFHSTVALCSFISHTEVIYISLKHSCIIFHYKLLCPARLSFNFLQFNPYTTAYWLVPLAEILDMSEVWYIFDSRSLTQCKYSSRSLSGPCSKWMKFWVVCMSDWIIEYCKVSSFLRSPHVKFGDLVFNLLPVKRVMYGSAVWFLGLSRCIGSHMYYRGAPQYTMLIFRFPSLCTLRQNKRKICDLYTLYLPIYYDYIFLLLQYHT